MTTDHAVSGGLWTPPLDNCVWRDAPLFCQNHRASLSTLDHAVEFRYYTKGESHFADEQWTRILAGYTLDGKAGKRTFVFDPVGEDMNLVLARSELISGKAYLSLSMDEDLAKRIKAQDRTFVVPDKDLKLSVEADLSGQSEYSRDAIVLVLMPMNAQRNAAYLRSRGRKSGRVCFGRPDLQEGQMRVQAVTLDGGCNVDYVSIGSSFNECRQARGVKQIEPMIL